MIQIRLMPCGPQGQGAFYKRIANPMLMALIVLRARNKKATTGCGEFLCSQRGLLGQSFVDTGTTSSNSFCEIGYLEKKISYREHAIHTLRTYRVPAR